MKEIVTETSVIWPPWYYSDNFHRNVLKECSKIEKDLFDSKEHKKANCLLTSKIAPTPEESSDYRKKTQHKVATASLALAALTLTTSTIIGEHRKKMLSERSLMLSGYSNNNTIDSVKTNCNKNNKATTLAVGAAPVEKTAVTVTPTITETAAAAYLYLEKVKNERMSPRVTASQIDSLKDAIMESSAAAVVDAAMVNNNNNNSINNNNNNNNNNNDNSNSNNSNNSNNNSIRNNNNNIDGEFGNINNNLINNQIQNQIANNTVVNSNSDELESHSLTTASIHQQHQQQQQLVLMTSNHVKKERLSPGTNGNLQTSLSRSRSTTPSSFRGTSPQLSIHSSPSETLVPMHNLSTNLLNTIHQAATSSRHVNLNISSSNITNASSALPTDFSTRNYSDFMRCLAAKYNNTNPNDNLKRNAVFEASSHSPSSQKKTSATAQKTLHSSSPSTPNSKEVSTTSSLPPPPPLTSASISPSESALKLTQQNKLAVAVANAAAVCSSNVSSYMTSFLSNLPFSSGIFPPLIDMSSTQALITLARAAKENEIHSILSASSQHTKRSTDSVSPLPSPSLNIALQQAAQFISPVLIYSDQLRKQQLQLRQQQKQHHQEQQQQQVSRQSSPLLSNISNSISNSVSAKSSRNPSEKMITSPLDLSSQPPVAKRFKAESISSQSSIEGLINTTISRRTSSSTATTSPSPPPHNEKSSNPAAAFPTTTTAATAAAAGSSTKTETATTAFTPIKIVNSTSATSSITPAITVRQCQAQSEELNSWTVDDVCAFVSSIDICAEYVKHFRDQCIDGSGLPLLTEDHLVNSLGMKLGPALKLRSVLSKKLGGPCPCVLCVAQVQQVLALQAGGVVAATAATAATPTTLTVTTDNIVSTNRSMNNSSYIIKHNIINNNNNGCNSSANKINITNSALNTASIYSTITNFCKTEGNMGNISKNNNNCTTNTDNFSSPAPQQKSPSQHVSNTSTNSNDNPITDRYDDTEANS